MTPGPGQTPHTYAEWVHAFDAFRAGEDSILAAMTDGTLDWSAGVAERWTRQAAGALEARLVRLSQQLQLDLSRAAGKPTGVSQALLSARRALEVLRRFASLPCAADDVRSFLRREVDRWASETQASLEGSARAIRSDHGRLLKLIRDHRLDSQPVPTTAPPPASPTGRRVIL